jgi:phosphoglycerate dehydrogenase-like enzyme
MPERRFTIFSNATLDDGAMTLLARETHEHELVPQGSARSGSTLAQADIAFGQPDPGEVMASDKLRWIHLTSAGYTRYDTPALRAALHERGTSLTNSSHVFDAPCAQHVLAMMLADARQLPDCYESQITEHLWQSAARREASYLLNGQTVLLLGLGAIARYLIRLLEPFQMEIVAVRRSAQSENAIKVVSQAALPQALSNADHVVSVLPDNASTLGFMNAERFRQMKPGARFYNVGRGKTVDQTALLTALRKGYLGAAYLDVTDPEPLPTDHPLWTAPRCFITPHCAGGHQGEAGRLVKHFVSNLRAFEAGEPLLDLVREEPQKPLTP